MSEPIYQKDKHKCGTFRAKVIVSGTMEGLRPECHAMSARQSKCPCQQFSSTDEKSHPFSVLRSPSSIFWNKIVMISAAKD